jgi:hypothetical protein
MAKYCVNGKRYKIMDQVLSTFAIIVFLPYNTFDVKYLHIQKSLILLTIARLLVYFNKNYKFTTGSGLLYIHVVFYHISSAIINGDSLGKINCERGEAILGEFKKSIKNYSGPKIEDSLRIFIEKCHWKRFFGSGTNKIISKKKFLKAFKINIDGYLKHNKFVYEKSVPGHWLSHCDSSLFSRELVGGNYRLKFNQDFFKILIQSKKTNIMGHRCRSPQRNN